MGAAYTHQGAFTSMACPNWATTGTITLLQRMSLVRDAVTPLSFSAGGTGSSITALWRTMSLTLTGHIGFPFRARLVCIFEVALMGKVVRFIVRQLHINILILCISHLRSYQ